MLGEIWKNGDRTREFLEAEYGDSAGSIENQNTDTNRHSDSQAHEVPNENKDCIGNCTLKHFCYTVEIR